MKRFALLLAVLLGAAACTKTEYKTEYVYENQIFSHDYQVRPSEWKLDESTTTPFYWVSFENKDITADVAKGKGAVMGYVYLVYDTAKNLGSWNPLPYVYPYWWQEDDWDMYCPEAFRMDWEEGQVTFIVQDMDGVKPDPMEDNLLFRVTVIK